MIAHSTFVTPDFAAPLDVERAIANVPEDATVRGMFFQMLNDRAVRELGRPLCKDVPAAFTRASMREYMGLLVEAARTLYPEVPLREGLRRVGHTLYVDFASTMVGKAIFSVAGRSFPRLAALAPRAYDVSYQPCVLRSEVVGPSMLRVSLRPVYVFPDAFHVGAWEGAARFCNVEPKIRIAPSMVPGHVDYEITYS